jgi:hypothetical protein
MDRVLVDNPPTIRIISAKYTDIPRLHPLDPATEGGLTRGLFGWLIDASGRKGLPGFVALMLASRETFEKLAPLFPNPTLRNYSYERIEPMLRLRARAQPAEVGGS